ncbi:hypothetical protein FNV43_RR05898 [Rhamnella rubrinervis]|uniref:Uncharacterized protein n=1 Tax=Rhamnella rubrinervis TaxID=2594499 RepID=A0A8K0HDF0_9ROSA|nr:hypothetical protein FNV43_RR05898 [Rhamnella rubrinervis]
MFDNCKAIKEYFRILVEKLKIFNELSKKWQRLSLLKASGRENPIEVYSSEEKDLEEDSEEDPDDYPIFTKDDPSGESELMDQEIKIRRDELIVEIKIIQKR